MVVVVLTLKIVVGAAVGPTIANYCDALAVADLVDNWLDEHNEPVVQKA